jgi:hypothetical protein
MAVFVSVPLVLSSVSRATTAGSNPSRIFRLFSGGVGDGAEGRIHREGEPIGTPFIAGPAIGALELAIFEWLGIGLYILLGRAGLLDQERVCRAIDCPGVEGQALERFVGVAVAFLEADEDSWSPGCPICRPMPPRVPKFPQVKLIKAPMGEC